MSNTQNNAVSVENIYSLDVKVPFLKSITFGLQHVLAIFVANIAPIMIVTGTSGLSVKETASLIQTAMIIAGIGTLVQLFSVWRFGAKRLLLWVSASPLFLFSATSVPSGVTVL